ncbi:DUF6414 family protein [Sorangium sp. So ce854]|uniref:DUF6414 family protein n=1 Tax=Sorangium sp. So ce854 TaxID=3133322 RepID=UPI003F60B5E0
MKLRELIYLDRERVDSYISQLAGGLIVEESHQVGDTEKLAGKFKASIKVVEFEVGGETTGTTGTTLRRIPAHAVLSTLEHLLEESGSLVDAASDSILPGQVGRIRGDATFESWSLLASLADSIQGIGTLSAKIYGLVKGADDLKDLRARLTKIEQLHRKNAGDPALQGTTAELASQIKGRHVALSVVDGKYVDDVKDVVKLFFQDQNHIRISVPGGKTFVGLLRKEALVGCTMEELLFTYGSRPQMAFGALFYVAEFGREETLDANAVAERFKAVQGKPFSLGLLQHLIREGGSALLELAEELRRPAGENAAFIVPLAIFRDVRGTND